MKKGLFALIILLAVGIVCIYIFVPATLTIRSVSHIQCSQSAAVRTLQSPDAWKKWFPADSAGKNGLVYRGFSVRHLAPLGSALALDIINNSDSVPARIIVVQSAPDSIAVDWSCSVAAGANPFSRLSNYRKALTLKKLQVAWLGRLGEFLDNTENLYGIKIRQGTVKDTLLLAAKQNLASPPTVNDIYKIISSLQLELKRLNGVQTGDPMIHVSYSEKEGSVLMAAIPVNRPLQPPPPFLFQKMVPGNLMVAQVKGGAATVASALTKMDQFFLDNNKVAMAIPFETLVTDRSQEPDTAAWITTLSSPVMR